MKDNNIATNYVRQVRRNEISQDMIISEVQKTIGVLSDYGIRKINLRLLGGGKTENQVCQIDDIDVPTVVSNDIKIAYYTTFNEIDDDCETGSIAIKDSNISSYRFMLIDVDPERPSGTCATETEKQSAITMTNNILEWFETNGFAQKNIIVADSGNGMHLLVPLNFIPANSAKVTVKAFLNLLSKKFSNKESKIDTTVYNPSRITRLYGTVNCKGEDISERPYRQSKLLKIPSEIPDGLNNEDLNLLLKLLRDSLEEKEVVVNNPEVYEEIPYIVARGKEWLEHYNFEFSTPKKDEYGNELYPFKYCPLKNHSNNNNGASFTITKYGRCRFKCLHESCSSKTINDFMTKYPCPKEFLLGAKSSSKEVPTLDGLLAGDKYTYGDYEISKSGIKKFSDKKIETLSSTPFFISQSFLNVDTNQFQYELQYLIQDRKVTQKISASILSPYKLSDLTNYGIILGSAPQKVLEYLDYQINLAPIQNTHSYVGWKKNNLDQLTFRLNKNYGDSEVSLLADDSLFKISSQGTFKDWKQMVIDNVLGTNMEIALCVGFSSIILGYLSVTDKPDIGSLIINFYGQSTSGKTTALHLINSIYAKPTETMYSFSATQNALLAILNENKGVVTTIDELSASKSSDLSELLYQIGQGQSRLRLNSASTLHQQFRFNTVIPTTSEIPMANYLNSNQGLHMRYLELTSDRGWTKNGEVADAIKLKCSQCYGVASDTFMTKLFKHEKGAHYISEVYSSAYTELLEKLPDTEFKTRIGASYAIIYTSAILIKELLNIDITVEKVRDFLVETEKVALDKRGEIPNDLYDKLVTYTLSHPNLFHIKDSYSRGGNKVGVIKQNKGTYRAFFFRDEMEKVLKKDFSISNIEKAVQLLKSQDKLVTDKRRLTKYLIIESNRFPMYCIELPAGWKRTALEFGILREY